MRGSEEHFRQFHIANNLHRALSQTRQEPGISLEKIAELMVDVFRPEEIEALEKHIAKKQSQDTGFFKKILVKYL